MRKPRGEAVLKNLPAPLQETVWQLGMRMTLAEGCAWLEKEHSISVSEGTLSVFLRWYPDTMTSRLAAATSSQLEATLRKLPELKITAAQARNVAQVNFELMAAQNRDPALFAMLGKASLENERLCLEREKFEESKKTDAEKGLDALLAEIKANPEALKHFEAMKAALAKGSA
jgi:hypothetical protein